MGTVTIPQNFIDEWNRLNQTIENLRQQNVEGQFANAQRDVQQRQAVCTLKYPKSPVLHSSYHEHDTCFS